MKNIYPPKEEILKTKPKFRNEVILITKLWKATSMKTWKKDPNWVKITKLEILINSLIALYRKKPVEILRSSFYAYHPKSQMIRVDQWNPSIISSLHETAHYLFGSSELKACRWSYWLFATCFPKSLEKLSFNGHMLKKHKHNWGEFKTTESGEEIQWCQTCETTRDSEGEIIN